VNLFETTVTVETTPIPEGAGNGLIRVFASDGLNTSYTDVRNVTVLGNGSVFRFIRGDACADGELGITDAIAILCHLFLGGTGVKCLAAADTGRQGQVNITSAVFLLTHLFLGGAAPPSPYPSCAGSRDAGDRAFGCTETPCP